MRNFMDKYHHQIDRISIGLFLYLLLVFIFTKVIDFIGGDYIYIPFALLSPLLIIDKKNINTVNTILHRIFRFKR